MAVTSENNSKFAKFKNGTGVTIERSNGRQHSATIIEIDKNKGTIQVEWEEGSDVKAKTLSVDTVLRLNPNLVADRLDETKTITPVPNEKLIPEQKPPVKSKLAPTVQKDKMSRPNSVQNGMRKSFPDKRPKTPNNLAKIKIAPKASEVPVIKNRPSSVQEKKITKPSVNRKSIVVGNVAKIQEKRENQRATHAKQRAEKKLRKEKYQHNAQWEWAEMIDEYRTEYGEMNPLTINSNEPVEERKITVCVRKRPLNTREVENCEVDCASVLTKDIINVHEPKQKVDLTKYLVNNDFRFDYIFNEDSTNELVYKYTVSPLVRSVVDGGMATCFAYGQTGSGKTHTMGGEFKGKSQTMDNGLYYFCSRDIFKLLSKSITAAEEGLYIACSFFEIYSGRVYDLMNNRERLRVMEDKSGRINVVNLSENTVENIQDVLQILQEGTKCRTSGQNAVNSNSSRSHAIFQLKLRRENVPDLLSKKSLYGQFSLIDLAGNERGSETANDRRIRQEGAEINKSLLALKECIRAMATNQKHLPFRGSTLTKVLRSSFVGKKSKTCMMAMISPSAASCEQTLNTLRYADRVKELKVDGPPDSNVIGRSSPEVDRENSSLGIIEEFEEADTQMSGMNLIESTLGERLEMTQEEIKLQKAMDTVQETEEGLIQAFSSLNEIVSENPDLMQGRVFNDPDADKDEVNKKIKHMLNEFREKLRFCEEVQNLYEEALCEEEQAVLSLEKRTNR